MSSINLGTGTVSEVYFGTRSGREVYLGNELVLVKGGPLYTGKKSNTSITDTISSGGAFDSYVDIIDAVGAVL